MDLYHLYRACALCPRRCGRDRTAGQIGFCGAGAMAEVNRIGLHFMEEPVISGTNGSGTVFFTHCTLGCVFCQNYAISRRHSTGTGYTAAALADAYLALEQQGAHNINLVSPTHYLPTVLESCYLARNAGLSVPFVYNTSGFERPEMIAQQQGVIDIYLTDHKYQSPYLSDRYSHSADYAEWAVAAIDQMVQNVGQPQFDKSGLLKKGVIIRHLMLPGQISDTCAVLKKIALHFGDTVLVSLMRQYTPIGQSLPDELGRTVTDDEYAEAKELFELLNLSGFWQEGESVGTDKIPNWNEAF